MFMESYFVEGVLNSKEWRHILLVRARKMCACIRVVEAERVLERNLVRLVARVKLLASTCLVPCVAWLNYQFPLAISLKWEGDQISFLDESNILNWRLPAP